MTLPVIDSRALRPRRFWYVVAVAIGLLGIVIGLGGLGLVLASAFEDMPKMTTEFGAGEPASVHLTAAGKQAIYVDWIGRNRNQIDAECTGSARGDGTIAVRPAFNTLSFVSDDGQHRWLTAYELTVTRDGDYELTCKPGVSDGPTHYGVGDNPEFGAEAVKTLGGFALSAVAPTAGIAIGVVIALVTGLRRGSYRKRLQQTP